MGNLADALMRGEMMADDLEPLELSPGLPERTEPHAFDSQWNPTRRAIERPIRALQWALYYPPRAAERAFTEMRKAEGKPVEWPEGGIAPRLYPQLSSLLEAIGTQDPSKDRLPAPGPRESDNIEDRRGPWWQYR